MFRPNQIFAAPLAGITDKPFRRILRKCAPEARLLTEMISCHSIVAAHKNCKRNFDRYDDEGNIGAQIFGAEPRLMADAAKILQDQGAKWIDINMGCPVPKVATRAGAGAYLMRDHRLAEQIIADVVRAVKIPVSVKTRLGWDNEHLDAANLVRIAADSGAAWATVHGRTRAQLYTGKADWARIAEIKKQFANFPIIFNGDIKTIADVAAVEKLGADGAMIGRALLGRPWLLGELTGTPAFCLLPFDIVSEHLELILEYYGAKAGVPMFRKHAAWYSAGMPGSNEFRTRINQITDETELRNIVKEFFNCNALA
ncbi:MAG: tRNA dihydrouridine synthase DusB [Rickettsiales bacterium]|jgi:tRNA-dihydrouridine synthase B|nr:tRNA dihydrouridine synthase DusB [Rickettsiales bacterium]